MKISKISEKNGGVDEGGSGEVGRGIGRRGKGKCGWDVK